MLHTLRNCPKTHTLLTFRLKTFVQAPLLAADEEESLQRR